MSEDTRLKVLFAASECVPFVKTGGLADVVGALPGEFDPKYWDVRVVIPDYTCIPPKYRDEFETICSFEMNMGPSVGNKYVGVKRFVYGGITYYFIDDLYYFDCFYPYSSDITWDIQKFAFFSKAVLSMLPVIGFKPHLIHCHDWQTGLVPVYLKNEFQGNMFFWDMHSIMTIHNLKFQGVWDIKTIRDISGLDQSLFTPDKLEYNRDANILKGGLVYADYITTVSRTYAQEIQTDAYGEGLHGFLQARHFDMQGIVNGIDCESFDPATDKAIYKNYTASNFRDGKKFNKTHLQEELELDVDPKKFVIGVVSRLTEQKGMDLIAYAMDQIMDEFTQMVVVGTGEEQYENMLRHFDWKYGDNFSANIYYSDELSRKVYAGCDAFLMPSRFEPCGLSQLISFRYGTIPIVRETGGLKDTVEPYNEYEGTGTGFSFANYNGEEMLGAINYAKKVFFENKRNWNLIAKRAIESDFSWKKSMEKYVGLYKHLILGD